MKNDRMHSTTLRNLSRELSGKRKRVSSWDKTGGNEDWVTIPSSETVELADIEAAGFITHIWITAGDGSKFFLREVILRIFWDGEEHPSVEVPLGDFFGMGHAQTRNFASLPLSMSPHDGRGMNCFFAMPFSHNAKVQVTNEGDQLLDKVWYYIDYEEHESITDDFLRFHASWNRENPTDGISEEGLSNAEYLRGGENLSGDGNYVILDAEGRGHYVGCNLNVENLRKGLQEYNWYGSGDDMIFIDGESFPPSLHGTGLEDYFNMAWCPQDPYWGPYHGIPLGGGRNWKGKISYYRFHIEDPVMFDKSILVTVEHGHANHRSDDYSSTAYWYQTEPHMPFRPMLPVDKRLPNPD